MIDHIYPIAYLGGSGGNFVSSWLNQAAYGMPVILNKINGNAHRSGKYAGFSIFHDQLVGIESLKLKFTNEQHKLFIASHIVDDDLLLNNFSKSLKITYDQNDVTEIAISFCAKELGLSKDNIFRRLEITEKFNSSMIKQLPETEKSTNLSWKTLLHNNPDELVDKLSTFYKIDSSNFNLSILEEWRELTLRNILNSPKL